MNAAMAMSPAQWSEMNDALSFMDPKTAIAFLKLCGYLRRFGSVPSGERAFCSILGVTAGFLRNRAWPLLEVWLVQTPDGQRYCMPEVTGARSERTPNPVAPEISEARRRAGAAGVQAREARRKNLSVVASAPADFASDFASAGDANLDANACKPHAKDEAKSTTVACGLHDGLHPFASPASLDARTRELSLSKEDSLEEPGKEERISERESSRASAGVDAGGDAKSSKPDANLHAKPDAKPDAKREVIRPVQSAIPADWKPAEQIMARAMLIRADAVAQVQNFIDLNTGHGKLAADWGPLFLRFLGHANDYDARHNRQPSIALSIAGGKSEPPAEEEDVPITGTDEAAQWARVQRALGKGVSRNWLGGAQVLGVEDGEMTIALPAGFKRDHVAKHYGDRLTKLWQAENPDIRRVTLVVAAPVRRTADG